MEQIFNFRPLAEGLKNRENLSIDPKMIFRSAALDKGTEKDIEYLKSKEIDTIYDLRSNAEINGESSLKDSGFKIKQVGILEDAFQNDFSPLLQKDRGELEELMVHLYSDQFVQSGGFAVALREIIDQNNKPFLFHCTAGKDRTGVLGAIIMMILDFKIEEIKEEYLRIDANMINSLRMQIGQLLGKTAPRFPESLEPLIGIKSKYIEAFISSIEEKYISIDKYILYGLGISDEDKAKLKSRYLDSNF